MTKYGTKVLVLPLPDREDIHAIAKKVFGNNLPPELIDEIVRRTDLDFKVKYLRECKAQKQRENQEQYEDQEQCVQRERLYP